MLKNNPAQAPQIINGGIHSEERGSISFVNDFNFDGVKRFYITSNKNRNIVRAWQGHKIENKFFHCVKGNFKIAAVKIDNWENPSENLSVQIFELSENESQILSIPAGYANGIKATTDDSKLLIFSDLILEESEKDIYRFNPKLWLKWETI